MGINKKRIGPNESGAHLTKLAPEDAETYILIHVAHSFGRTIEEVMEDSWVLTLWTYGELQEYDRIERLKRESIRMELTYMIARAFHQPESLQEIKDEWLNRAGYTPDTENILVDAEKLMAELRQQGII